MTILCVTQLSAKITNFNSFSSYDFQTLRQAIVLMPEELQVFIFTIYWKLVAGISRRMKQHTLKHPNVT